MSNDSNSSNAANETRRDSKESGSKRQQFTSKQRMDMYAFCVLELEMHSNKVSIKKQQQAIQRVLNEQQREDNQQPTINSNHRQEHDCHMTNQSRPRQAEISTMQNGESSAQQNHDTNHRVTDEISHNETTEENGNASKTLLQLQQEVALNRKCYSDYQKTQVLTSSMLRDVQKRFAKYYPDSAIPSRTTIKHVFSKCVTHGTVENIKTPRRSGKYPHGDEIERLLIHKPHLSLRQLAQKLNVSTGTVSRRCKALGIIPYSVTLKHQQLATARRQKQIKQLENQSRDDSTSSQIEGD